MEGSRDAPKTLNVSYGALLWIVSGIPSRASVLISSWISQQPYLNPADRHDFKHLHAWTHPRICHHVFASHAGRAACIEERLVTEDSTQSR